MTTVANELGRPDDGTDSTGFFNNEFYVGLKPYNDRAWSGSIHTKPDLIKAIQKKLAAFPGIIFNYTQPAEDAVDEAETGLKSSLAVKIFGPDLATLEDKAVQVKNMIAKVPGITEITVVRELGQPSLMITPDRAKLARYGLNVSDVNTLVETAMGGTAATQVIQGERQFDLVVRMQEPYRSDENAIKNLLIATPDGQYLPLSQFCDIKVESGASFIYREIELALHRRAVQRGRPRPGRRGGRSAPKSGRGGEASHRLPVRLGRRIQGLSGVAGADEDHSAVDRAADSADPVRAVRKSEIPADHLLQRAGDRAGGRAAGAVPSRIPISASRPCWVSWR